MKRRLSFVLVGCSLVACRNDPPQTETSDLLETSPEAGTTVAQWRGRVTGALPPGLAEGFRATADGLESKWGRATGKASARVLLPKRANGPARLEDLATGTAVGISLNEAGAAEAQASDGYLVYRGGGVSGGTMFHRPLPDGVEDYLSFDQRPSTPSVSYRITLTKNIAGLRLVANTLEFLDAEGTPRLRVSAPYLTGADGAETDAVLAVEGCAFDRNPAGPWGRAVTAPGASHCTVRVSWDDARVTYPAVLDPKWTNTGSMAVARQDHTAVLLPTNKVLIAGGRSSGTSLVGLNTAELYDRTTLTFSPTGSFTDARCRHTATLLAESGNTTTSGKVLIAGGINGSTTLQTAQLYSPSAGTWMAAAAMGSGHYWHTATRLANGKVLVTGGMNGSTVLDGARLYDPTTGTGSWGAWVATMSSRRRFHTATLLNVPGNAKLHNKVLVVGGNSGGTTSLASVELFDGVSTWTQTTPAVPALSAPREGHTATTVGNGKVLIAGGMNGSTNQAPTFLFDPTSGSGGWAPAGNLNTPRGAHSATALAPSVVATGQVLVFGGSTASPIASAEVWNAVNNSWTNTTTAPTVRARHTATLLATNEILIAGGLDAAPLNTAQLFDPSFATACTSNSQCSSGACANGVCCNSACANPCMACNLPGTVGTCAPKGNGSGCDDDNKCTQIDSCQNGTCVGGGAKVCPAGDACRPSNVCDPMTGACPVASTGTSCTDGNPCNGDETCDGKGVCKAGTPVVCVGSAGCAGPPVCHPQFLCSFPGPALPGQTCTASDACSSPGCTALVNVPDPTPDMEDQCWRQRDIPLRFVEYGDGTLSIDDANYVRTLVTELNETFAKACLTFHARTNKPVRNTIFSNYRGAAKHWTDGNADDWETNFDWAANGAQWALAVPQNPNCSFARPGSGKTFAGSVAQSIYRVCGIPDELIIMSNQDRFGGQAGYRDKSAYIHYDTMKVHEIAHSFSLNHPWEGPWEKPTGVSFGITNQTDADWWDLVYVPGNATTFNRLFSSFNEANTAGQPTERLFKTSSGVLLPGSYTPAGGPTYTASLPPKTGPDSCEQPTDGGGPCATRSFKDGSDSFCTACEFRRMYEAWNGPGTIFPPTDVPSWGLVYAPGQLLSEWRRTGRFSPGFAGFELEKGDGRNGPALEGVVPRRTKLQSNSTRRTAQITSYESGAGMLMPVTVPGMPKPVPGVIPGSRHTPQYEALSDSQAALVRNTLKYDVPSFDVPLNPQTYSRYPARGSWEKIGERFKPTAPPVVVAAPDGVFITAQSQSGRVVYRHWAYGDAPWAAQTSGPNGIVNGPAWLPVNPAQTRTVQGRLSAGYRPTDGLFDMAIRQVSGTVNELQNAMATGDGQMRSWGSVPGTNRGSPVLITRRGPEGDRVALFTLGNSGTPQNDRFMFNEWQRWAPSGPTWSGWRSFDLLSNPLEDGFDVALRPDGHIDLVAETTDGKYYLAILELGLGWWNWGDLGNPSPGGVGFRASLASTQNTTSVLGSSYLQLDIVATDQQGRVWYKGYTERSGWWPSLSGSWAGLGGENFGRATVSHSGISDLNIVARDTTSNAIMFKRWRSVEQAWSPSQGTWFNLGGEAATDPVAVQRAGQPSIVDVFYVDAAGDLWHRPYVVPPYRSDRFEQQFDVDYDAFCGCGQVDNTTALWPGARLGSSSSCPCSR